MTIETIAELQTLLKKLEEVKTERAYLAEVYNGLREVSMTFYYKDKTGNNNYVNTFAFSKTFPFDIMTETKIMLRDAIEHYDEIISEIQTKITNL
jgi:hypothetical protein